jgi:hypothetical protein
VTYIIKTRVVKVERKELVVRAYKIGDEVFQDKENLGWFVLLEHSHEYLYLGQEQPDLVVGQKIRIRIEIDE